MGVVFSLKVYRHLNKDLQGKTAKPDKEIITRYSVTIIQLLISKCYKVIHYPV